jgi:hypothetical protein
MEKALDALVTDAETYLDELQVQIRDQVSQYRIALWLWHRLKQERWKDSQIGLRTKRTKDLSIDVDHVLSIKSWEEIYGKEDKQLQAQSERFTSDSINMLGNCILLEKDFNISKGKKSMRGFLSDVHEFKGNEARIYEWAQNMDLDETLMDASEHSCDKIVKAIQGRTRDLKEEIREWIHGHSQRFDAPS